METMKFGVLLIWVGSTAAIFLGDGPTSRMGHVVLWGTLLAHLLEFVWKLSVFRRAGGDMTNHFVQTMIYGLFYWKPIQDRQAARNRS